MDLARVIDRLRREPFLKTQRIGERGGEGDALNIGRELLQTREGKREEVAALTGGEGMHLVNHHPLAGSEKLEAFGVGQQQRERFRRRQQNVRRLFPLALLPIRGRVPAAGFDPDR